MVLRSFLKYLFAIICLLTGLRSYGEDLTLSQAENSLFLEETKYMGVEISKVDPVYCHDRRFLPKGYSRLFYVTVKRKSNMENKIFKIGTALNNGQIIFGDFGYSIYTKNMEYETKDPGPVGCKDGLDKIPW